MSDRNDFTPKYKPKSDRWVWVLAAFLLGVTCTYTFLEPWFR